MKNMTAVVPGMVAVSRDCFPIDLSVRRCQAVADQVRKRGVDLFVAPTAVESEQDMLKALSEVRAAGVNALVVFLGNFGPESAETLLAQLFDGPVMFAAAAEESGDGLMDSRGDAYCGMLNASYNLDLRGIRAYIPESPVGTADEVADMLIGFLPIARTILSLRQLKIISFCPRPQDFLACNAPIKRLYDLGVEIEENSELDLYDAFLKKADDPRIAGLTAEMAVELGIGNKMPGLLPRLAQYELALVDWAESHRGSRTHVVFANKCWPSFERFFGFVPCYVNSRFAARGMPISCEVDIYGALSEYIGACITEDAVTILDVNNTVPADLFNEHIRDRYPYQHSDTFMGFHCGNTPVCKLRSGEMRHQKIMYSTMEAGQEPDITRGTLEGDIQEGAMTLFRLQSTADTKLKAYIAQGEILNVATRSFGGIGIVAIPDMRRFYRHVLIEGRFPHHAAVAFSHVGRTIFEVLRYLGVTDIEYNRPASVRYPSESPF